MSNPNARDFRYGGRDHCLCGKWRVPQRTQIRVANVRDQAIDANRDQIKLLEQCLELLDVKLVVRFQCPKCQRFVETVNDADATAAYEARPPEQKA
jgi:hypothetical protein